MTAHTRVGGSFKDVNAISTRVGGSWKEITDGWTKVGGAWKPFYASVTGWKAVSSSFIYFDALTLTGDDTVLVSRAEAENYGNGRVANLRTNQSTSSPGRYSSLVRETSRTLSFNGHRYDENNNAAPITLVSGQPVTGTNFSLPVNGTWQTALFDGTNTVFIDDATVQVRLIAAGSTTVTSGVALGTFSQSGRFVRDFAFDGTYYIFIAAVAGSEAGRYTAVTSGATRTNLTLPVSQTWTSIAYGNGTWVTIARGTNTYATSTNDGTSWTQRTLPTTTADSRMLKIRYVGNYFIFVSASVIYFSEDGINWDSQEMPANSMNTSNAIAHLNGFYFVGGQNGTDVSPSNASHYYTLGNL